MATRVGSTTSGAKGRDEAEAIGEIVPSSRTSVKEAPRAA